MCATSCSSVTSRWAHSSRIERAEQADALGQGAGLLDALLGQRNAFVEAAEVERVLDAERAQGRVIGEFLDLQHHRAKAVRKGRGKPATPRRAISSISSSEGEVPNRRIAAA